MSHNPFHDLEGPIAETANATQILAYIFEDLKPEKRGTEQVYTVYDAEHTMLAFMIYDLCGRTQRLEKAFDAAHKAEASND